MANNIEKGIVPESKIIYDESPDRLKVTIPVKVNWFVFALHTLGLGVWLVMVGLIVVYLFRGLSNSFVLTLLILLWTLMWLWFGRFLFNRWQYYAANREILFFDEEQLIVRRPLSILGITNAYDINYVSPFYYSEKHQSLAFDYAYAHVFLGHSLEKETSLAFINDINERYFPEEEEDE